MDIRIIEFLTSRICHDLISPVGAVHNGIEFLQDMAGDGGDSEGLNDAIDLIAHSASQAAARLQVFRMVYGAGARTAAFEPKDVYNVMHDYVSGDGKTKLIWDSAALSDSLETYLDNPSSQTMSGFCKILLCGLLLAHECLPKGGDIDVKIDMDHGVLVTASGRNAQMRDGVDIGLSGQLNLDDIDPRLIHSHITHLMGQSYGYNVTPHSHDDNDIAFIIKPA